MAILPTVPAPSTRCAFILAQMPPGVALAQSLVEQHFLAPFCAPEAPLHLPTVRQARGLSRPLGQRE